jgi:hypothetical protein
VLSKSLMKMTKYETLQKHFLYDKMFRNIDYSNVFKLICHKYFIMEKSKPIVQNIKSNPQ